jgi:hypothetical protein
MTDPNEFRRLLEQIAEAAIELLDALDGNPDDEDDGTAEDNGDREMDDAERGCGDEIYSEDLSATTWDGSGHEIAESILIRHRAARPSRTAA